MAQRVPEADLGGRFALKVLLSSEDALSASRYEGGGAGAASDVEIETEQIGIRLRLGDHPWRPFVGAFAGRYADERSAFGGELEFEAVTVGVEAGADVLLASATRHEGWFLEPRGALGYTWAEQSFDDAPISAVSPSAAPSAAPSADAEAVTALAALGVGHRWHRPDRWRLEVLASLWWLHTEPGSVDAPFSDRSHDSEHLRLQLSAVFPLRASLRGHALELATGLVFTELDDDVGRHFAADRLTEASVALLARTGDEKLPVDAAGLVIRYLDAEGSGGAVGFDGWTLGVTVSD